MLKTRSKEPLADAIANIASAKPEKIFGATQKLFRTIAKSDVDTTCDMFEAAILLRDLNTEKEGFTITRDVLAALADRLMAHKKDSDLRRRNPDGLARVERIIRRTPGSVWWD